MMEERQLKKFLAGLCIAGLLSGAGATVGCAAEEGKSG
jgi:radical SAM modification target selenobiotic family peptide